MKFKIFILFLTLLMYHLGLTQNADTLNKGTFKIARCQTMIANKIDNLYDTIPHPRIDNVTVATLLKDPEVKVAGCSECKVISFETIMNFNGVVVTQSSSSEKFTPQMIKNIKQLPIGSNIIFDDVHIKCPGANSEIIPGRNLIISNKD
jgi:hypothetical protein